MIAAHKPKSPRIFLGFDSEYCNVSLVSREGEVMSAMSCMTSALDSFQSRGDHLKEYRISVELTME